VGGIGGADPLQWNGEDALALGQVLGRLGLDVSEERMQRGEPVVAGLGADAALVFEVVEKGEQERGVDVGEAEPLQRRLAGLCTVSAATG